MSKITCAACKRLDDRMEESRRKEEGKYVHSLSVFQEAVLDLAKHLEGCEIAGGTHGE